MITACTARWKSPTMAKRMPVSPTQIAAA